MMCCEIAFTAYQQVVNGCGNKLNYTKSEFQELSGGDIFVTIA